ncbi:hypothetical protein [Paraburkholderia lacunae]|nr:hypothetical protein [Paraburkholderia lacunae]
MMKAIIACETSNDENVGGAGGANGTGLMQRPDDSMAKNCPQPYVEST